MFIKCSCQHCGAGIEFDSGELSAENCIVPCPHCGLDTTLAIDLEARISIIIHESNSLEERSAAFKSLMAATKPEDSRRALFAAILASTTPQDKKAVFAHLMADSPEDISRTKQVQDMVNGYESTARIVSINDVLELAVDRVVIRRRGLANALAVGLYGERSIVISTLTSIQMTPGGLFSPGYILFTYAGSRPFMGGLIEATQDPDAFIFESALNDQVSDFKAKVEKIMLRSRPSSLGSVAPSSLADEIRKLSELRGQGLLSQAEFDAAKQKLLA